MRRDLADQKRFGRITVPAFNDRREVDVDDVSFSQQVVVRDAVADHFVDAGANRVRVAVVAQAGRCVAVLDRVVVRQLVDLSGGNPCSDVWTEEVHDLSIESAGGSKGVAVSNRRVDRDLGQRPSLWP